jgi:hypothetical protein
MTFTAAWSVGWYFIPIASLWKPFQALREIWKASVDPVHWQSIPTNPLLGWWWAGFLVSNILDQASFRMSTAAHGLRALHDARVVAMISDTTDIIAIVLACALVERLYRIQIARAPTI